MDINNFVPLIHHVSSIKLNEITILNDESFGCSVSTMGVADTNHTTGAGIKTDMISDFGNDNNCDICFPLKWFIFVIVRVFTLVEVEKPVDLLRRPSERESEESSNPHYIAPCMACN